METIKIAGIEDRGFWSQAHKLARRFPHVDVDDLHSELVLATLELLCEKPHIAERGPGYVLVAARWRVFNQHRYDRQFVLPHDGQLYSEEYDELFSRCGPDASLQIAVEQIVGQLSRQLQKIFWMLLAGYRKSEIANDLGLGRSTITYHVKRLRTALTPLLIQ